MEELKGYDFKNLVTHEARRVEIVDRIVGWACFFGLVIVLATDIVERIAG